jgi:hypothetical protein
MKAANPKITHRHRHTLTHSLTLTHSHTHTHAHTHTHTHTLSLSLPLPLSHTHTDTYTHIQGTARDREKREVERQQLADLVGRNLTYISQLDGLGFDLYSQQVGLMARFFCCACQLVRFVSRTGCLVLAMFGMSCVLLLNWQIHAQRW